MASGHVNRINRPNTWLHRPTLRREVLTCQPGAVHTWHLADECPTQLQRQQLTQSGPSTTTISMSMRSLAALLAARRTGVDLIRMGTGCGKCHSASPSGVIRFNRPKMVLGGVT